MTKEEAVSAMKQGKKVTHTNFMANEYVFMPKDGYFEFEDGVTSSESEFWSYRNDEMWENGWSIIE